MKKPNNSVRLLTLMVLGLSVGCDLAAQVAAPSPPAARIRVDPGHPWRPPFGLDRVGKPLNVEVNPGLGQRPSPDCWLVGYSGGKEIERRMLRLTNEPPSGCQVTMAGDPDELVLVAKAGQGEAVEVARLAVPRPPFEAEAIARPDPIINPVDLGTVLVPADWLLLGPNQRATVEVAALSRVRTVPEAKVEAWYESSPKEKVIVGLPLIHGRRVQTSLILPVLSKVRKQDTLEVAIADADGRELWHKQVRVMVIQEAPVWPAFGAVPTKLRYDAPIEAIRAGQPAFLDYEGAWDATLRDVVVFLPNGARFVFWRGSSYIPFWAGRFNTGLCYEWAERLAPNAGFTDCPEPLMDKELRYGRVEIVESTAARVRVRWKYQSCDLNYKVNGDLPVEDYCFYPDGFGTRTLQLTSIPEANYELNEFIVLTPQAAFPFDVLPPNLVDILSLEGAKAEFRFPCFPEEQKGEFKKLEGNERPIYRIRLSKHDTLQGVQFCPWGGGPMPPGFGPFYDRGYLVTPTYWGGHWPLSRGLSTGSAISDRMRLSPAHNSIMTAADKRPQPIRSVPVQTRDALGQEKTMKQETWVWLIGMTDANDEDLAHWARSFVQPPALELEGARKDSEFSSPERRALRLVVEARGAITIVIKPADWCVNPVFELRGAPKTIAKVQVGDQALNAGQYAWDGLTLWLAAQLSQPTTVRLEFGP